MRNKRLSVEPMEDMYKAVLVPVSPVTCWSEIWLLNEGDRSYVN